MASADIRLPVLRSTFVRQAIGRGIAEESRVIDLPVHVHERLGQQRKARSRLTQQLGREPSPNSSRSWRRSLRRPCRSMPRSAIRMIAPSSAI
jgi:DNA-directed RNA polymerase sigma subunit (sigma70/sigma32)